MSAIFPLPDSIWHGGVVADVSRRWFLWVRNNAPTDFGGYDENPSSE